MADSEYNNTISAYMTERLRGRNVTEMEQGNVTMVTPSALPLNRRLPGNISIFEFLGFQQALWYDWLHDIGFYTFRRLKAKKNLPATIVDDVSFPVRQMESQFVVRSYSGKDFSHDSTSDDGDREIGKKDGLWADNTHPVRVAKVWRYEYTRYDYTRVEYVRVKNPDLARNISGYIDDATGSFVGPATYEAYIEAIMSVPEDEMEVVEIPEFYPATTDTMLSQENAASIKTQDTPVALMPWGIQYKLCRREPAALKSASPFDTSRRGWKYKFTGHVTEPTNGYTYAIYTRFWDNLVSYDIVARSILERDYLMTLIEDFHASCAGLFQRAGIMQSVFLGQTSDPVYLGNSPASIMKEVMTYAFYRTQEFRVIGPLSILSGVELVVDTNAEATDDIETEV